MTNIAPTAPPSKPKRKRKASQFAEIAKPEHQTDIANAERFAKLVGDRVRFVTELSGN